MVKIEKPTFSIRLLLVVVALAGFCFAGLINHTPIWASAAVSGTLLILAYGTILALFSNPEKRMFWSSFSISSWLYFVFAFCGPFISIVAPYLPGNRLAEHWHPSANNRWSDSIWEHCGRKIQLVFALQHVWRFQFK